MGTTCCFTGHRKIPWEEYARIREATKKKAAELIEEGVTEFFAGGAVGFDMLAEEAVLELKEKYPHVRLTLVLPCPEQAKSWKEEEVRRYEEIKERADKIIYTSEHYHNGCMHVRNKRLVAESEFCICYLTELVGGTRSTVDFARKSGLTVFNVY